MAVVVVLFPRPPLTDSQPPPSAPGEVDTQGRLRWLRDTWHLDAVPFGGRLDGWGSISRSAVELRRDRARVIPEVVLVGIELVRPPTRIRP
ncbi:MAG TPA: hypothetical protein PKJ99_06485 [Thermoanaerobaculales bacterium]|nr:hypothetical protein [Thermoanaerobaculales bacterium]HPA80240.1 hypothetical protein [Thermoanaerobaculales bacterium]HQN97418.1 hypothetical protein [Thermoanaerobaculales bacterium]HQP44883.1 hypothetical protein [Thermoanaerobaculales bacterium]